MEHQNHATPLNEPTQFKNLMKDVHKIVVDPHSYIRLVNTKDHNKFYCATFCAQCDWAEERLLWNPWLYAYVAVLIMPMLEK